MTENYIASAESHGEEVVRFYDAFSQQLLRNYVDGNLRHHRAIEFVRRQLGPTTRTVLDIGCGIGESANEIAKSYPDIRITAVDISPRNIEIARKLFSNAQISFQVGDMMNPPSDECFDQINLIDVYEHIPIARRPVLHQTLAKCLAAHGTVVLTTPSKFHQKWLHDHHPGQLQVIDETIELSDICRVADDLGATITHYQMISVWHTNDYVHVAMKRNPPFVPSNATVDPARTFVQRVRGKLSRTWLSWQKPAEEIEREKRREHVQRVLGAKTATQNELQATVS